MKFWTFTVILTLATAMQSLHKTLKLIMLYHPIKVTSKRISSSADMVETVKFDGMNPNCDLHWEDSKPIFLHDTPAHDHECITIPSLVT